MAQAMTGEEMVALCRKHTIYEWSAQTQDGPHPRGAGPGRLLLDARGQALPRLQQPAHVLEHRALAPEGGEGDPGPGRAPSPTRTRSWPPSRARGWARSWPRSRPGDIDTFFFTNGGAEAVENAIRVARVVTGRHKVMVRYRSYHGGTAGALTLTGDPRRWASEPGIPGVVRAPDFHKYGRKDPEPVAVALAEIEDVIRYEGGQNIAAFIMETVVGTNGILIPPDGYMQGVREICDRTASCSSRRGHVRLRPHRQLVRGRPLERGARPHHHGQGHHLGLRAARGGGHAAADRERLPGAARSPAGSPTTATPWPAPPRSPPSRSTRTRACSRTRSRWARILRERHLEMEKKHPSVGTHRAPSASSASSSWCATARPSSPWRPTTAPRRRWRRSAASSARTASTPSCAGTPSSRTRRSCINEAQIDEAFAIIDRGPGDHRPGGEGLIPPRPRRMLSG